MKTMLWLAAAGGAGAALPWLLALPPGDPLAGTLRLLPAVAVALVGLERWGAARGGRRSPRWLQAAECIGLGIWLLATATRHRWGFLEADLLLIAALFALLGQRLLRLLLTLRPSLGHTLPARPPAPFFWLPLVVYLAILPWSLEQRPPDGDEPYYLLLAHSLAYDFDTDLAENYARGDSKRFMGRPLEPQPGDPVGPDGAIYSRHNLLLPLLLAAPYRLAGRLGAAVTMALLTAALAWWTLRAARHVLPRRPGEALAAYGLLAFSPPLILYSSQIWVEVPAALLAMIAADAALASRLVWPWGPARSVALALPMVLLPLLKLRLAALALPLLALAAWRQGGGRPRLLVGAAAALGGMAAGIALFNVSRFGKSLKIYSLRDVAALETTLPELALGALGLFFDGAFGLFASAPLWLLLVPALLLLARRQPGLAVGLLLVAAPMVLLAASRSEWYGGWSPPFRYGIALLPLLALALPPLFAERRRGGARLLLVALGSVTAVLTLCWLAVPGWTYNLADGSNHLMDRLGAGLGIDVARILPSAVRPGPAIWVWPPLAAAGAALLWWWPRRHGPGLRSLGVALTLGGAALLPLLALSLPTRVVHFEDTYVAKSGGALHPPRWTLARHQHRGAWVLPEGESLSARVVPGGRELTVRLHLGVIENVPLPPTLHLRAGEQPVAQQELEWDDRWPQERAEPRSESWREVVLGPVAWPAGEPLVLALVGQHSRTLRNAVVLDRAELSWR